MVTILVKNYFFDLNVYNASVRHFNGQPKFDCHLLNYKRVTKLTILRYENKAFVYILNVEVKIPIVDLMNVLNVRNGLFMLKMNKKIDKSA